MAFKEMDDSLGFADLALANSLKHNRSLKLMENLNGSTDWIRIESVLLSHCTVGTASEGADVYPPLMLFKCLLLHKWFRTLKTISLIQYLKGVESFEGGKRIRGTGAPGLKKSGTCTKNMADTGQI